jgi:hypothetical protein
MREDLGQFLPKSVQAQISKASLTHKDPATTWQRVLVAGSMCLIDPMAMSAILLQD